MRCGRKIKRSLRKSQTCEKSETCERKVRRFKKCGKCEKKCGM